ncbi:hypothetical protein PGT21_036994 [Puccinia graminis f. sp. tritici]|uniref:ATP-dependent DNA helicase sgs1 n=1 Tax=Puccinia graminis f. sp. tritici TaxID=56615 RepID=A0A5B0R3N4_PUCGR|nr:hypothetical protein PGT21_036994 [Puccinia graminis f. sp. tritici]
MIRPKKGQPKASLSPQKATTGITPLKKLLEKKDDALKTEIATRAKNDYNGQDPKPIQVETVATLARGKSAFFLAGTGFGKSRIAEMYFKTLPPKSKPVVLVLNH